MTETDGRPATDTDDEPTRESDKDLTPPHGDALRQEVTFGRTDRYANVDDEQATHEQPVTGPEDPADNDDAG